ncbi:MAG: hypothetical protein QXX79_04125 [Candidatus Bathyarchaeia archaeon]
MALIAFVAWSKLSKRTKLIAEALGIDLWFFKDHAPYMRNIYKTLSMGRRAKALLVQLPQGPLLAEAMFLKERFGCKLFADVHTAFLVEENVKGIILNKPFRSLLKHVDVAIAHNACEASLMPRDKTIVVYDPWVVMERHNPPSTDGNYLVMPCSFHSDEPVENVLSAAAKSNIKMYVTGDWRKRPRLMQLYKRFSNITFTGFLPEEEYLNLLAGCRGMVAATKREYTTLCAAWEALAFNKPLALSNTKALKQTFDGYAAFFDWQDENSIAEALEEVMKRRPASEEREKLREITFTQLRNLKSYLDALVGQ